MLMPATSEAMVKHGDIPGFMPAMTMVYRVKDADVLKTLTVGDLLTATLVVSETEVPYLRDVRRTGHAPIAEDAPPPKVMHVMQPGEAVPADALQDQDGVGRKLAAWDDKALAITFIYTRCPMPDFCPLMDRKFVAVQKAIAADAQLRTAAHLVSVTVDPTHDTAAVLKEHAAHLGADPHTWSFVTGPADTIANVASRFGVSATPDPGGATLTHNLRTAVVDRHGRLVTVYSGSEWMPDTIVNDLRDAIRR
jgi:protein SCO1/2